MKPDRKWIEIEGAININVTRDEFEKAFLEWLTSKDWYFAGVTNEEQNKAKH